MEHYFLILAAPLPRVAWHCHTQTNIIMKNFTLSIEALLLILLLIVGLYGVHTVLKSDKVSPGLASPRQEAPAMVITDETAESGVYALPN